MIRNGILVSARWLIKSDSTGRLDFYRKSITPSANGQNTDGMFSVFFKIGGKNAIDGKQNLYYQNPLQNIKEKFDVKLFDPQIL